MCGEKKQDEAFTEIKTKVTQAPVLAYYDCKKPLQIQCDASMNGIGSVLMQDGRLIRFASKALTPTESRYAVIEKGDAGSTIFTEEISPVYIWKSNYSIQ